MGAAAAAPPQSASGARGRSARLLHGPRRGRGGRGRGPQGWRAPPPAPWDAARRRRRRRRRGIDRPPPASWWSCRSSNRETVWGGGREVGGGGGLPPSVLAAALVGLGPRPVRCGRGCVKNCRIRSGTAAPRLRLRVTEEGSTKGMRAKLREDATDRRSKSRARAHCASIILRHLQMQASLTFYEKYIHS